MPVSVTVPAVINTVEKPANAPNGTLNVDLRQQANSGGFIAVEVSQVALATLAPGPCTITITQTP